jgi:Tfp pilus assembly protein PilF
LVLRSAIPHSSVRVCCIVALGFTLHAPVTVAAPRIPTADTEVLQRLPVRPNDPTMREIRELRYSLAREPQNLDLAIRLARRYFEQALAQGDPRYVGYAQAALKPWWDLPDPPTLVLVMRATLVQYRHDFPGALTDLDRALEREPDNARAWSLRMVIHLVQADYVAARRDCAAFSPLVDELSATGCVAFIDGLTGGARKSLATLDRALARARDASAEQKLWLLERLAEMAWRLNDAKLAEQYFKRALALGITDGFLLAAYADFLLDYGRAPEVITLLKDWTLADPLLLRLALAEQAVNAPAARAHQATLADRYAAARLRGDTTHEQEESRFTLQMLKQPAEALRLALSNWRIQKEPRDARVLLEAAHSARRPDAAQPVLDWMSETRIEDWYLQRLADQLANPRKDAP